MKKVIFITALIVLVMGAAGFVIWANNALGPMPEAEAAMQSNPSVQVSQDEWIVFQPTGGNPTTGLIIYPGGRVDPVSYAPIAQQIAAQGYLVAIVPMPLNLAFFGANRAGDVIAAYPQIEHWAIAGHSLGGSMAAGFIDAHDQAEGLALWAAYPASSDDLSDQAIKAISVSASNDGLATPDDIAASIPLLPPDASFMEIQGGNHAQFGWYGDQPGDGLATISRQEQQNQTAAETIRLLQAISMSN
jgi:dienelactone hydrolase